MSMPVLCSGRVFSMWVGVVPVLQEYLHALHDGETPPEEQARARQPSAHLESIWFV